MPLTIKRLKPKGSWFTSQQLSPCCLQLFKAASAKGFKTVMQGW